MTSVADILTKNLNELSASIADNIKSDGRNATGKTIDSLEVDVVSSDRVTTGQLLGREDITALEDGFTNQQFRNSNATFQDIQEWVLAKGINSDATTAIWRSLNIKGWNTTLPNRTNPNGGTKGIISDPINDQLKKIEKEVGDFFATSVLKEIEL